MHLRLAAALLPLALPALARPASQGRAALQDCSVVASEGLGAGEAASSIGLAFAGERAGRHVVAAAPRSVSAPAPETELHCLRPGVSYGAALTRPEDGGQEAAFTLVTVEPGGTVLLETWRWRAAGGGASPPASAWSRLRCGP